MNSPMHACSCNFVKVEGVRWSSGINAANGARTAVGVPYNTYRETTLDKSLTSHCL